MIQKRGVRQFLSAGLNRMGRNGQLRPTGSRTARVIAVAAQKGGVGKTTTSVNLACALAGVHGQKTLIIDIDPQGHVTSSLRESVSGQCASLSEILLADRPRDLMDAVMPTRIENLHLTAPDKRLSETEGLLSTRVGREYVLQGALVNARSHFDVIIIDCPPNLGNLTLNALLAAEQVLIPCDMSILAFEGVADILGTVETVNLRLRHPLDVLGIVRTRVDGRTRTVNETIGETLAANYGELVLDTHIPLNSALARAQTAGLSVFQYDRKAPGAAAYANLASEVLSRLQAQLEANVIH